MYMTKLRQIITFNNQLLFLITNSVHQAIHIITTATTEHPYAVILHEMPIRKIAKTEMLNKQCSHKTYSLEQERHSLRQSV